MDWITELLRMVQLLCGALLFGVPLFSLYGPREASLLMGRTLWVGAAGMLLASLASVVLQASSLAGTSPATITFADLAWYMSDTHIGRISGLRSCGIAGYAALVAFAPPGKFRDVSQTLIGSVVLGSFALTGHGAENAGHSLSDFVHLIMAGVWIGALVSLCVLLVHASRNDQYISATVRGLNSFSRLGFAVVALLVASGIGNALFAFGVPSVDQLSLSEYGRTLLLKLGLLTAMLVLAALNRYRLAPLLERRIGTNSSARVLRWLRHSVLTETAIAVAVIGLAAHLASTEPPV